MKLANRYDPPTAEAQIQAWWQEQGVYAFAPQDPAPVYAIDTPPATVSGNLHLGHMYSYTQTDFQARFWRMNGHNVFYPMGYDDNGLPTGRYVFKLTGLRPDDIGWKAFAQKCKELATQVEQEYEAIWRRLGLSVDWRYTYRTIDEQTQRISQFSFLELYEKGLIYRTQAPAIWCPECGTAIAQAELNDLNRVSTFYTLAFQLEDGQTLPIATTRPELLPACVAVFVHPDDERFAGLAGRQVIVPHFGRRVPILQDKEADPTKGTGAVMCCTFGDVTDVAWWRTYNLPLIEGLDPAGRLAEAAGELSGLSVAEGRQRIVQILKEQGQILEQKEIEQSVRVHERCDTPVEYIVTGQWFLRVLEFKPELLQAGEQIAWHPAHMQARYRQWVENLNWDWCLSRQRSFGMPFPLWHCPECGQIILAEAGDLPVDPREQDPPRPCTCGNSSLLPETDVMDTWATSSLTPQIVGRWLSDPALYERVYPMSLRPHAHDIIRTWTFYTIVKSFHHFHTVPWSNVAISGWGIAGEGTGKISKSRGGGPMPPKQVFATYSADAVRYWAASTGLGKDAIISEQKIQLGAKLVNKLWNVARFSQNFLSGEPPVVDAADLSAADRWILSRTQQLIERTTTAMRDYEHAAAKNEIEAFFWTELADNYLEMAKLRLYNSDSEKHAGALYTLYHVLLDTIKLFAPFLPHVTEQIYRAMYATEDGTSIHTQPWPQVDTRLANLISPEAGAALVTIATAARRFKSEHSLPLGSELRRIELAPHDPALAEELRAARPDIASVTRAQEVRIVDHLSAELERFDTEGAVDMALLRV